MLSHHELVSQIRVKIGIDTSVRRCLRDAAEIYHG